MSLKSSLKLLLNRFPFLSRVIGYLYMHISYAFSNKIKSEGNINRLSPDDKNHEYFFGYYDKSPWDASGRYVICMRAKDTWSQPDPLEPADIILIDTRNNNTSKKIATTHTWNVQQGCMAQWLGPDFSSRIIYNDQREGNYCSVILEVYTGKERILPMPVYTVSADGKTALSLDFSRLHNLRLGYGYAALPETTKGVGIPDATAVWRIDIESGKVVPLLKYTDFAKFEPRSEMLDANSIHKVNHLMLSPNGKRFMVLYRWFVKEKKYTRLITCNVDGTGMYLLSDDDMVSHCFWKNDEEILAFEHKHQGGDGYYLMKDKSQEYIHLWPSLTKDGHPSYNPVNNHQVVTDTYPSSKRIAEIKILRDEPSASNDINVVARVFAPFRYQGNTRCDLHPRWSRDGKRVCFDSIFEGHRGLYYIEL